MWLSSGLADAFRGGRCVHHKLWRSSAEEVRQRSSGLTLRQLQSSVDRWCQRRPGQAAGASAAAPLHGLPHKVISWHRQTCPRPRAVWILEPSPLLDGLLVPGGCCALCRGAARRVDYRVEGDLLRVPALVLGRPRRPPPRVLVQLVVRGDAVLLRCTRFEKLH
jgi:hypothetical protein